MSNHELKPKSGLNYPGSAVSVNIARNIRRPLPQVQPHDIQQAPIGLICGGPSLMFHLDEIKERSANGLKLVSVNGSHDWLLTNGMYPSAHVMVDSRPSNARFVKNYDKRTKYLIASQCHPRVFETLENAEVYVWHAGITAADRAVLEQHYLGNFFVTPGGSTVALRALSVLRMLGFINIEIWGMDSCVMDGRHHAYEMPENNGIRCAKLTVGDKDFWCEPWMHSQAEEFLNLSKFLGDELNIIVHGDGLIAHLVKTGAELATSKET